MRWEALELARFARKVGFVGDDVTTATALAIATSGGVASYDVMPHAPGCGHWVGLWGIDVDRWPEYAERDLHVPHINAETAYELHQRFSGWEWSPVYRAGSHRHHLSAAGTARTREYDHQRPVTPFGFPTTDKTVRNAGDRLARLRSDLQQIRSPRRA